MVCVWSMLVISSRKLLMNFEELSGNQCAPLKSDIDSSQYIETVLRVFNLVQRVLISNYLLLTQYWRSCFHKNNQQWNLMNLWNSGIYLVISSNTASIKHVHLSIVVFIWSNDKWVLGNPKPSRFWNIKSLSNIMLRRKQSNLPCHMW